MKTIMLTGGQTVLLADSAMGRDSMPLFLPEGQWKGEAFLALRIGRLGKGVSQKFALRYVDGLSIVLVASPAGADRYPSWLGIMDGAVTAGRWIDIEPDALPDQATASAGCGQQRQDAAYAGLRSAAAAAVSDVTKLATIRTGDVIIPPLAPIKVDLRRDTRVEAWLEADGRQAECLRLKVK